MHDKPVFFVVGAAKSGTSSLYEYLDAHPAVHMCPHKDVACYFCRDYGLALSRAEYMAMLMPDGSHEISGDGCHAYLTDPESATAIASEFPDAKIVIVLRNPVDKAHSQYGWMVNHGYERLETFEEALEAEERRFERNVWKSKELLHPYRINYLYFRSGLYASQVARYLEAFSRERVLISKFDDLRRDSAAFVKRVYAFLGVDTEFVPPLVVHNRGGSVRSVRFQYFCRRKLTRIVPGRTVRTLMRLNTDATRRNRLDPHTRRALLSRYREDIEATEKLSGLSLQDWLS